MARKAFGVFVSGDEAKLKTEFIVGIKNKAKELDCNVVVFDSVLHKPEFDSAVVISDNFVNGETSMYFGHDFSALDVAIMMGDTIMNKRVKDKLITKLQKYNIPIVDVDDQDDRCYSIVYDDTIGMENIVRHVVEKHGVKKIDFMSGYEGNRQSEERLLAYKKVLAEHNIPIEKGRIVYGQFGFRAVEAVEELLADHGVPEAIICANDVMAITTIKTLRSKGYNVPEDCIVTGFDGIDEGQAFVPKLTTIKRPIETSGKKATEMAYALANGEDVPKLTKLNAELLSGQSCGCEATDYKAFDSMHEILLTLNNDKDSYNFQLAELTREVSLAKDIKDVLQYSAQRLGIYELKDIDFYLSDNLIKNESSEIKKQIETEETHSYSDYLEHYSYRNGKFKKYVRKVKTDNYLKERFSADSAQLLMIIPLYHNERILGFMELEDLQYEKYVTSFYAWVVTISSSVGNLVLRKEMKHLVDSLNVMYVRDQLTGLYNRFGLLRETPILYENAASKDMEIFVDMIDLDRLKMINDTYGHEAGDNAINQIANALMVSASNSAIIARIGGDEFIVVDYCRNEDSPSEFEQNVSKYLEEYNNSHIVEYLVDCSCGNCVASPDNTLENMMKIADERMYIIKSAKKEARRKNEGK